MQKIKLLLVLGAFASIISLNSCKDDEDPVRPKLKFDDTAINVNESSGTIQIALQLDQAYSKDIEIEYEIDGTAIEGGGASADYEIIGAFGSVDIDAGETEAFIEIQIKQDTQFEGDETIELSISDVDINDIIISEDDEIVITIRDDDTAPKVSVAATTMEVFESYHPDEGYFEVDLVMDNAMGQDVTITYSVTGTAIDSLRAYENEYPYPDYYVHGNTSYVNDVTMGEITIPAGETTVPIELNIYSDFFYEPVSTIIIELKSATNGVTLGTNKLTTINLKQENGMAVQLGWDESYTDVDMDLFFWVEDENNDLVLIDGYWGAANASFQSPEILFMPSFIFPDGRYGFSYNYYEGTANPMNFYVIFAEYENGILEDVADRNEFEASYSLANLNPWVNPPDVLLSQSYLKTGDTYSDFTAITIHESGSRKASTARKSLPNIDTRNSYKGSSFKRAKKSTSTLE